VQSKSAGFTLIELIIVVLLLGIVSATALPRFLGKAGVEEITAQDQIISVLRRMQTQAMQQTSAAFCHQLILTQTQLGFPNILPCDADTTTTQLTAAADQNSTLQFNIPANSSLSLSLFNTSAVTGGSSQTLPFLFQFNALGQVVSSAGGVITTGLRIEITDAVTYRICIEPEGYIHSC
jgi:MSHA pilin protein MshC